MLNEITLNGYKRLRTGYGVTNLKKVNGCCLTMFLADECLTWTLLTSWSVEWDTNFSFKHYTKIRNDDDRFVWWTMFPSFSINCYTDSSALVSLLNYSYQNSNWRKADKINSCHVNRSRLLWIVIYRLFKIQTWQVRSK